MLQPARCNSTCYRNQSKSGCVSKERTHALTSRITTAPAGAGQTVLSFIHSGSSAGDGFTSGVYCVPGI